MHARKTTRLTTTGLRAVVIASLCMGCSDGEGPSTDDDPPVQSGGRFGAGGTSSDGGDSTGGSSSSTGGIGSGGTPTPGSGGNSSNSGGGGGTLPSCPGNSADAYEGSPASIPGVVQGEDFDTEGYWDDSPGNEGNNYRTNVDVDIKSLDDGYAVGWMNSGEWLEYTVNVEVAGSYRVTLIGASVDQGRSLELSSCGNVLGEMDAPVVSQWGELGTMELTMQLEAGLQVLRVSVGPQNSVDFDSLDFELESSGTGGAPGTGGGDTGGTGGVPEEIPRFVGNITTYNSVDTENLVFSDYWDQITPENAGKWGSIQRTAGSAPDWTTLDAIYDYAQEKGIVFKQHAFVWGSQQPSGSVSEADVKEWMSSFCERYPNTRLIDVVNEPPPHTTPSYTNAIGGGTNGNWQWITNSFIWAREACPNAILILNDFNNIEWQGDNQHFINIVNTVLENGGPIDALGAQAHDLDNGAVSFQTVDRLLNKLYDDTGLPIYITEMDISTTNDQQQLQLYEQYFPYFWEKDFIPGVTIWGWIYGRTWASAPNSGLVRDGQSRPAMQWLMNRLERPVP